MVENGNGNGNGYSKASYYVAVIGGGFTIFATVIGAIFWISSIAQSVETNRKDNVEVKGRLGVLESTVGANGIKITTLQRNQNEIETQFCANDIVRNLMHANDLREVSLLWSKVYGTPFPIGNAYYPTICNRNVPQ